MLGLDTNVLLRYVLGDDPQQAALAAQVIEEECTPEHPGYVNQIVLCEFVWSLSRGYGYSGAQIIEVLQQLLRIDRIAIEGARDVAIAIEGDAIGTALADSLIARRNVAAGCIKTVTFDRTTSRLPGMILLAEPRKE